MARYLLPVLHDQLVVSGEQIPPRPGKVKRIGSQRHAAVEVPLSLDIL